MAFFVIFSRFFKNVYSAYTPVFFAVKGGSHPGKNPPIYTVLNAAFSCAKTLCRGSQCTTRARPSGETKFFTEKKIFLLLREFCPHKISKKNFKKIFFFFKKYFLEKIFFKIFWKKIFLFKFKVKFFFYLNKIYFYKKFFKKICNKNFIFIKRYFF